MSLFVQRSDVSEFRKRFRFIALGMALLFLALLGRLFQLQILETDDNKSIARENIVRRTTLATTRGIIRDRTGKVLAASRPAYNIYVVPSRIDMAAVWPKLVDYLGMGLDERTRLEQHLLALRAEDGKRKDQQILLKEDISRDAVANLSTHEAELMGVCGARSTPCPCVELVPTPVRYYPYDDVGAHVLGYMAEVDGDRLATLRSSGYLEGDRIGVTGVEPPGRATCAARAAGRRSSSTPAAASARAARGSSRSRGAPIRSRGATSDSPSTLTSRRRSTRPSAASSPAAWRWSTCAPAASSGSTRSRASIRTPSPAARASR